MRRREIVAAAAGAVVATVLAGSVAWAAIPNDSGFYTACMLKGVGTVRLIDKSLPAGSFTSQCKPTLEVEITWNRQGPQGLPGEPGEPGAPGPKGDKGDPGDPAGLADYQIVSGSPVTIAPRDSASGEQGTGRAFATCPPGTKAIGGSGTVMAGFGANGPITQPTVFATSTSLTSDEFSTSYFVPPGQFSATVGVRAVCARG